MNFSYLPLFVILWDNGFVDHFVSVKQDWYFIVCLVKWYKFVNVLDAANVMTLNCS